MEETDFLKSIFQARASTDVEAQKALKLISGNQAFDAYKLGFRMHFEKLWVTNLFQEPLI